MRHIVGRESTRERRSGFRLMNPRVVGARRTGGRRRRGESIQRAQRSLLEEGFGHALRIHPRGAEFIRSFVHQRGAPCEQTTEAAVGSAAGETPSQTDTHV